MFIVPLIFCLSCTKSINANVDKLGDLPTPLIEPLPLTVGVYYANDFRNYKITRIYNNYVYNVQLGKANTSLFDYILSSLFKKVISVQNLPNENESIENYDIIIEPRVFYYDPYGKVYLKYEIQLYFSDGKKMSWQIFGKSGAELLSTDNVIKNTQDTMRNIAAQFMTGFCNQKDIQKLFYKQCNQ
jgi:hypothetical protein